MAPFYTAAGDTGETSYLGPGGISKSSLRIEAVGSVDEANAAIGLARALSESEQTHNILFKVQQHLYLLMTELSASPDISEKFDKLNNSHLQWLEAKIAELEQAVEIPKVFITPGSSPASGALDLARTIIRRAERRTVALLEEKQILKQLLVAYLNRLSSLLFVLEVYESSNFGHQIQLTKEI
jgi:cob(I)alamin adenosyltransferase